MLDYVDWLVDAMMCIIENLWIGVEMRSALVRFLIFQLLIVSIPLLVPRTTKLYVVLSTLYIIIIFKKEII